MCGILDRDDDSLKYFDQDLRERIIKMRNNIEWIIKELSEFLHHPKCSAELVETLEYELNNVKMRQEADKFFSQVRKS
jgi:hypothetical protein